MNRLEKTFARLAERDETALVAYLTGGWPNMAEVGTLIEAVCSAGADIVELGVPFSDPLGDGPVIQATTQAALAGGTTAAAVLEVVDCARNAGVEAPIMLMGYCNPFLRYGLEQLYEHAAASGADGFIVPDLPPHEADEWLAAAETHDLGQVFFSAPGSGKERLQTAADRSRGFLYALAANGVTGVRAELDPGIDQYLERVTSAAGDLPVCVGFGISRPEHVRSLRGKADGVIVGSALLNAIKEADSPSGRVLAAAELIGDLKAACR
ncbi:tryptophan synthase subunit alpha [Streptomyces sp. NBC_01190]|uniref:tryptophan synthase subunit alpha n=1 Tax=Streptomyces sp. NBC_01190 TaxID=2903767 RepID=UPI00386E3BBD|nr:tryptophan synthase subunit alpha [Streptomyces sp. NBC_01190]